MVCDRRSFYGLVVVAVAIACRAEPRDQSIRSHLAAESIPAARGVPRRRVQAANKYLISRILQGGLLPKGGRRKFGDIMAAEAAASWPADRVTTLPEALGAQNGWNHRSGSSVFKSVGTAVQDLAAARAVTSKAAARGVGREVDLLTAKTF